MAEKWQIWGRKMKNLENLRQNLTKISENQPKLVVERFFFVGQNIRLVRRAGEEKRMDSNNIHLCLLSSCFLK